MEACHSLLPVKGFNLIFSKVEMIDFSNIQLNVALIGIGYNRQLCYLKNIETINPKSQSVIIGNKNEDICARQGKVCSALCSTKMGCWGPRGRNCFQCRYWRAGYDCIKSCEAKRDFYTPHKLKGGVCGRCHADCEYGCFGPDKNQCYHGTEQVRFRDRWRWSTWVKLKVNLRSNITSRRIRVWNTCSLTTSLDTATTVPESALEILIIKGVSWSFEHALGLATGKVPKDVRMDAKVRKIHCYDFYSYLIILYNASKFKFYTEDIFDYKMRLIRHRNNNESYISG